jgi:hypothetical protein
MHGLLYINDERVGEANLQLAFGQERAIQLRIYSACNTRNYTINEGDVYVNGSRLGVRGFVVEGAVGHPGRRRPVMMTFELIPIKQSLAGTARRFAARLIYPFRWSLSFFSFDQGDAPTEPRSITTGTAAQ